MARPLDETQVTEQEKPQGKEFPAEDVEIALRMAIKLLHDGNGLKMIADAITKSKDPAQVVGKFLAQMMGQMAEQLRDQYGIDPGIFIAKNGFLDQILDYIETQLGYPEDFSDKIYAEVLDTIKAAAMAPPPVQGQVSGPGAAAPQEAGPPQPQGGM